MHSVLPKDAEVLLIGEAPGEQEDKQGRPFVGPAGDELTSALLSAGFTRDAVAVVNVCSCRPPANRAPTREEAKACFEFLDKEIQELKPKVIVTLGTTALASLIPGARGITQMRGRWFESERYNCLILPTYHPAYVLPMRHPEAKSLLIGDLKKVKDYLDGKITVNARPEFTQYQIKTERQLDWLVDVLNNVDVFSCDTETTSLNHLLAKIFIISFSWADAVGAFIDTRYINFPESVLWEKLKLILGNPAKKIFQNGSFDIKVFMRYGIKVRNYYCDTLLMHHLLQENSNHGLDILAMEYTNYAGYSIPLDQYVTQHKHDDDFDYSQIPIELLHPYAVLDAIVTLASYNAMLPLIYEEHLDELLFTRVMPAQKLLMQVEYYGVTIDREYLTQLQQRYEKDLKHKMDLIMRVPEVMNYKNSKEIAIRRELERTYAQRFVKSAKFQRDFPTFQSYFDSLPEHKKTFVFNPQSPTQLRELLIDRMHLPVLKSKTSSKGENPSLDKSVLEEYAKTNKFCSLLAEHRSLAGLKAKFVDGMLEASAIDGKAHTEYLLFGTVTGRPSSRNPNLNNIPTTSTSAEIKNQFIPDSPDDWIVEVDGSQMEFRTWCNYSQDPQMLHDLEQGVDIHKLMAAAGKGVNIPKGDLSDQVYKEIVKDVTKAQRQEAKAIVFGVMYGRSSRSVAAQLGISEAAAQKVVDKFFGRYPVARTWILKTQGFARVNGYVVNLFGRRRRLLKINSKIPAEREEALRQAVNSPIQGGASDIVLGAGIRIYRRFAEVARTEGLLTFPENRLILTVYDSLCYTLQDKSADRGIEIIYEEMTRQTEKITVKLDASIKIGKRWGETLEFPKPTPNWRELYYEFIQKGRSV